MNTPSTAIQLQDEGKLLEAALLQGDLAKMTSVQRVEYYREVCESVGLNPFSRPFEYIVIKGKLTLYPTKSCAEQLRAANEVSIDEMTTVETDEEIIVTVKGHDKRGRKDIEIGAVSKKDMDGNLQNIRMKAMSKAKRRLGFSLCGMGWVDERYIEAVTEGTPVSVNGNGDIRQPESFEKNIAMLYAENLPNPDEVKSSWEVPPKVSDAMKPTAPGAEPEQTDMRPFEPETLKNVMDVARDFYENEILEGRKAMAGDSERKVLAAALGQIFVDKNQRYVLCKWLTGEASTKSIESAYVYALLRWMKVSKFDDITDSTAKVEAHTAYPYALKMSGQLSMFDETKGEK